MTYQSRRRTLLCVAGLVLVVGMAAPVASADDPPATVPTPTVPAPDPAPPAATPKPPPPPKRSSPPVSHQASTPVTKPTFTPRPAPVRQTQKKTHPFAGNSKRAKKTVSHKPAQKKGVVVKPVAKPKPVKSLATPRQAAPTTGSLSKGGAGWLKWVFVLVFATGLMAVSARAVLIQGTASSTVRRPARRQGRVVGAPLRRRNRAPIREVVPEVLPREVPRSEPIPLPPATAKPSAPEPPPVEVAEREDATPPPPPAALTEPLSAPLVDHPLQRQERDAEMVPMEEAAKAEPLPTEELCEILVWRGYAKARFYARLDLPQFDPEDVDGQFAVAESSSFRFNGNGTPEPTEAAKAAHQALVEKLVAKGWEQEPTHGPWYAARFSRPLEQSPR
jgi:hypothetical protein